MSSNFYGKPVRTSANDYGAIGVVFNKGAVTMAAYKTAEQIFAAGDKGVDDRHVMAFDVQTLQAAGVPIGEKNFRFYLEVMPKPKSWLVPETAGNVEAAPRPWK